MASTYTPLGVEKMATGENAGTWGTKTNTNLEIIEQFAGGYTTQAVSDSGDTTLSVSDGSTGATLAHRVIDLTGALTGARNVTIPIDVQQMYVLKNSTTGSQAVTFKYVTGTGSSVAFTGGDTSSKIVYGTGSGSNPNIIDLGFVTTTGTQTLTNKTLTAPKIADAGYIADANGAEQIIFQTTSSAVNELEVTNAATGNSPILGASGETNVGLHIKPKGSGETIFGSGGANATLTTSGAYDLILDTNAGTNAGTITLTDGANGDITIAPNGTGVAKAVDAGDNTAAIKIAGKETMWVPASAMYGASTNGADAKQVETTATRPDMKVLDFDPSTAEYAQFSVAFPKSWAAGTVTYQVYWTPATTNTGNCIFGLQGVSCGDDDTIDVAYGTGVEVTDAGIGVVEDQQITSESGAVTITAAAAGEQTYFQLYRDAADGSDTFTGDARVLGIRLFFTTDLANDA
jgi:hypothetical protein